MGKKIIKLIIMIMAVVMLMTACGSKTKWGPVGGGAKGSDAVSSNGGFMVQKGDFLYFINGVVASTDDNTFGTAVKGSLLRVKASDFSDKQVIIPKLLIAGDLTAGVYIFDNYIYYATPNNEKDKYGEIQNSYLDFCRTTLDGSKTERLKTVADKATSYKFIQDGKDVYLVYYEDSILYSHKMGDKKPVELVKDASSTPIFSNDYNHPYVYYTRKVMKESTEKEEDKETEKFNQVFRKKISGGDEEKLLDGVKNVELSQELSFAIKEHKNGVLYLTFTDAGNSSVKGIYGLKDGKTGIDNAVRILVKPIDGAYYLGLDDANKSKGLYTVDAGRGIIWVGDAKQDKIEYIVDETKATIIKVEGDYLYYSKDDASGYNLYRVKTTDRNLAYSEVEKIGESVFAKGWYAPEFIGDKIFFANASTDMKSYIYVLNNNDKKDAKATICSKLNKADAEEADKKAIAKELKEYKDKIFDRTTEMRKTYAIKFEDKNTLRKLEDIEEKIKKAPKLDKVKELEKELNTLEESLKK